MPQGKEEIFDEQITPLVQQIAQICQENEISFNSLFQYGPRIEDHCQFILPGKEESFKMFLSKVAILCQGNIDSLFIEINKRVGDKGHNSLILAVLNKKD